jgi:aldehyde:ferredoxin oxidoreductase
MTHEPIFAAGSMLGVTDCFAVLDIIDVIERMGLDVMSAGNRPWIFCWRMKPEGPSSPPW